MVAEHNMVAKHGANIGHRQQHKGQEGRDNTFKGCFMMIPEQKRLNVSA
jgi:hypothetical protein